MGSMHTGLEEAEHGFQRLATYFAARAKGGAGLLVTGGIAPNRQGWLAPFGAKLSNRSEAAKHQLITGAVHAEDGKICLQILHGGRYSMHPFAVAPSPIRAHISTFRPWGMSERLIRATISDFADCAALARSAGYDGVEIMGSEGYLINQFIAREPTPEPTIGVGLLKAGYAFHSKLCGPCGQKPGPISSSFFAFPCSISWSKAAAGRRWKNWRWRLNRPARASLIPELAGMKPGYPPLPPWCRGAHTPG